MLYVGRHRHSDIDSLFGQTNSDLWCLNCKQLNNFNLNSHQSYFLLFEIQLLKKSFQIFLTVLPEMEKTLKENTDYQRPNES